jgi:hypothetical protein
MHRLPKNQLEAIQEWNARRGELQAALGENIFVPKVSLYEDQASPGPVLTGITWAQMVSIALPEVNEILLVAIRSARRLPWSLVAPLVAGYSRCDALNVVRVDGVEYPRLLPFRLLDYQVPPPKLRALEQQARPDTLSSIDIDDVVAI